MTATQREQEGYLAPAKRLNGVRRLNKLTNQIGESNSGHTIMNVVLELTQKGEWMEVSSSTPSQFSLGEMYQLPSPIGGRIYTRDYIYIL
jgi:hypothetical protein